MSNLKRHVGRLTNTGQRCVVVFRKIPTASNEMKDADPNWALIVQTDQLPDMYHDNIMQVIDSKEAQQSLDLFIVLQRRTFGDGTNILTTLHNRGFISKVKVDDVTLYPFPNHPLPLRDANNAMDGVVTTTLPIANNEDSAPIPNNVDVSAVAAGLIVEAEMLESEANAKKEQAYSLDPSLRPKKGRKNLSEEEKARRHEMSNTKRREKYAKEKNPELTT